jgi:hypothetical protein
MMKVISERVMQGCTLLAVASNKVYQLLSQGRWFSPGTPASTTTKTGRHDIAEILLKVALKHQAVVNRMERSDWSIEISKNKLGIFGCI